MNAPGRDFVTRCHLIVGCLAAASFLFAAPPLHGQDGAGTFWTFLKDGTVVTRCAESSAAHKEAGARLDRLDERIKALRNADPVFVIVRDLHALLKTECFLPAAETPRIPHPDTALSLKEWWTEAGGREWLASFLQLPRLGSIESPVPHVVVPPDVRKTLNLEAHRKHSLAALLCPLDDVACGAETRGWKLRATEAFRIHAEEELRDDRSASDAASDAAALLGPNEIAEACRNDVSPEVERYRRWRECVEGRRPGGMALPLGEFKAPTTGWLIIEGRRGHYNSCDTKSAYNLANGAAFIHDDCCERVFDWDGDINHDMTKIRRFERVRAGTIPVENLREALWMMLLRNEAEKEIQLRAAYYPLPAGLKPTLQIWRDEDFFGRGGFWVHSGQTELTWRWTPTPEQNGVSGASYAGELTWPNSADAAENHAAALLDIAEEALVEGCPPTPAPDGFACGASNPDKIQRE